MMQLTWEEMEASRSQFVTLNVKDSSGSDSPVRVAGDQGRHSKFRGNAFTEQGVAMLSSVLRSPQAVAVNVEIMRAFVRLRGILASHADLERKVTALEKKYDAQFKGVFDAIRELMTPPPVKRRKIGFRRSEE